MRAVVEFLQLRARSWVFRGMKTFLKVVLLLAVALIAIKLLPLTIGLGFAVGVALVGLMAVGLSLVAGVAAIALLAGAVLSPIWVPVLLVVGSIVLIKRSMRRTPSRVVA